MTEEQIQHFFQRIDNLSPAQKPLFGKMNVNQMVCHCADQIRLALGTLRAEEYGQVDPKEILSLAKAGKPVPAAKGLGQVEGGGTKPTNFGNDVKILKQHILEFSRLKEDLDFPPHPYFGRYGKEKWTRLSCYHLDHHLKQFNV